MQINNMSGFNPQQIMQDMQNKIQAADTDANGSISKLELEQAAAQKGNPGAMPGKLFERADANGDGELSAQEQEQMFTAMQDRFAQFANAGMPQDIVAPGYSPSLGTSNNFESLLNSLAESETEGGDNDYQSKLSQYQNGSAEQQQAVMRDVYRTFPEINVMA